MNYSCYENIISGLEKIEESGQLDGPARNFLIKRIRDLTKKQYYSRFISLIESSPQIKEFILETINLPETLVVKFFPKTDQIHFDEKNEYFDLIRLKIGSIERELLNLNDFLTITISKKQESLFDYTISIPDVLEKVFSQKAKLIATGIALTVISSTGTISKIEKNFSYLKDKSLLQKKRISLLGSGKSSEVIEVSINALSDLNGLEEDTLYLRQELVFLVRDYLDIFESDGLQISQIEVSKKAISDQIKELCERNKVVLPESYILEVSEYIKEQAENTGIDHRIFLAIIETESKFNQAAVSSTGDYSLAQINYKRWNEERIRLGKSPLDFAKLKADPKYSLEIMADILQILKTRFSNRDPLWFARYHSSTKSKKEGYAKKLIKTIRLISQDKLDDFEVRSNKVMSMIETFNVKNQPGIEAIKALIIKTKSKIKNNNEIFFTKN